MPLKVRASGQWNRSGIITEQVCISEGYDDLITNEQASISLPTVAAPSATQAVSSLSLSAPAQTTSATLLSPAVMGFASAGVSGTSFTPSSRAGGSTGDTLFLFVVTATAEVTAPTIAGWSKLSGFDGTTVGHFAVYKRTADGTATDLPTVPWVSGVSRISFWSMTAVRGMTAVDVGPTFVERTSSTSQSGLSVTTINSSSLVIEIMSCNNSVNCTAIGGPYFQGFIANVTGYLAYRWVGSPGASGAPIWTMNPTVTCGLYALVVS